LANSENGWLVKMQIVCTLGNKIFLICVLLGVFTTVEGHLFTLTGKSRSLKPWVFFWNIFNPRFQEVSRCVSHGLSGSMCFGRLRRLSTLFCQQLCDANVQLQVPER